MFGMPVTLRIPDVIGVRLSGALREGVLATDLALTVTEHLRRRGVSGDFVEFYGAGVSTLSAGERSVVANMAPEYGASTGYFPIDEQTLRYLRATGRDEHQIMLVEAYAKSQGLWFDASVEPRYSDIVQIDMSRIGISLAGPQRPQDRVSAIDVGAAIAPWMNERVAGPCRRCPEGAVAIAAITSCTNTSDPRMIIAAVCSPEKLENLDCGLILGSRLLLRPDRRPQNAICHALGLLEDLVRTWLRHCRLRLHDVYREFRASCSRDERGHRRRGTFPVAVLSGNRNFPGRVHPQIEAAFLASPPLVVAYALAGDVNRNISEDVSATDGGKVLLKDLWPTGEEIDALLAEAANPLDYGSAYDDAEASKIWRSLDAPGTPRFPGIPSSTYLRRPPFVTATGTERLRPLYCVAAACSW